VASFLNEEFDGRMVEGGWLFLFDSFDEIPELLSVTETGTATERYEQALRDFVTTLSRCRGVIASREFRSPPGRGRLRCASCHCPRSGRAGWWRALGSRGSRQILSSTV
jgi:hypothetical protein